MNDWWSILAWYEHVIVWPLAIAAFVLLVRAKSLRARVLFGSLLVVLFLPHIQMAVGNVYFDHLCKTQAGEFIYRTVDNVEGILQMRPRDGSKDYFDRMRAGDIPEDPWGHTNVEAQHPEWLFVNVATKYRFLEVPESQDEEEGALKRSKFKRYWGYDHTLRISMKTAISESMQSKYAYTWKQLESPERALFSIYGGQIDVVDLSSREIVASKRGYLMVSPRRICPNDKAEEFVFTFISKVLRPVNGSVETKDRTQ